MSIQESVQEILEEQCRKGLSKYGYSLDGATHGLRRRVRHLQEEMIDGAQYAQWLLDGVVASIEQAFREGYCEGHKHRQEDEDEAWENSESKRETEQ